MVMLLFEFHFLGVQIGLKGLVTVMPLSTPCLIAFFGDLVYWYSYQNLIGPRHSFDVLPFTFFFFFYCFDASC
jgi:hypothetical protein